jgi:glycosyltransferase involved in cell wall biosynthesis
MTAAARVAPTAITDSLTPLAERGSRTCGTIVIELVGLPGAGKSTIAHEALVRLRAAGLRVADDDLPPVTAFSRAMRYGRCMLFSLRHPALIRAVTRYVASCGPLTRERLEFARDVIAHAFGATESKRSDVDVVLLSQGAAQAIWSLGVGSAPVPTKLLHDVVASLRSAGALYAAAAVDVTAATAAARMAERTRGGSRFDRLRGGERRTRLESEATRMTAIGDALGDSLGERFVRLDGRVPAVTNASALTSHIDALRTAAPRQPARPLRRVTLFVPDLTLGGAERVMVNLSRGFVRRGLSVDLLLVRREGIHLAEVPAEVRIITLGGGRTLFALPSLVRYLRRERPEALLSTLTYANVIAIAARRLARVKTRITVREANSLTRETAAASNLQARVMPRLSRWLYPSADAIVAVSRGAADSLVEATGTPPERIHVLDNPIVTDELPALARESVSHPWLTSDGDAPVLLAAGRLTAQKDFQTLLRAFSRVRRARPARLIILGEGELRDPLQSLSRALAIDADVSFPGVVRNPFAFMARASLFVLSSAWEGSPGVLIQAMACGAPVVATDCESGPREILASGRFGTLVPVGDVDAMAEAIEEALRAPRRPPESSWARFSIDAAVESYLSILGGC